MLVEVYASDAKLGEHIDALENLTEDDPSTVELAKKHRDGWRPADNRHQQSDV